MVGGVSQSEEPGILVYCLGLRQMLLVGYGREDDEVRRASGTMQSELRVGQPNGVGVNPSLSLGWGWGWGGGRSTQHHPSFPITSPNDEIVRSVFEKQIEHFSTSRFLSRVAHTLEWIIHEETD